MATDDDETRKAFKALLNETLDERDAAAKAAAEEAAKNQPPAKPKGLLEALFGGGDK